MQSIGARTLLKCVDVVVTLMIVTECLGKESESRVVIKFRYCEKATKFENNNTFLEITYLVRSKQSGSLFQIFVAYSKYLNFNDHKIFPYSESFEILQATENYCRGIREASKDLGVVLHSRR